MDRIGRTARAAAVLAFTGALLTACSGSGSASNEAGAAGGGASARDEAGATGGDADGIDSTDGRDDKAATGRSTAARVVPGERDVVYRGQVTVRVRSVRSASVRAEGYVRAVDGMVVAEESTTGRDGRTSAATLTVRVPPESFRDVLGRFGRLGRPLSQTQTAEDVTAQVVDTDSRIQSQRRSVARVRSLLGEADTIGEVVQIESELARREADLESLEAQLAALEDVTGLSTITLTLVWRDAPEPTPDDEDLGFLAGLRGGWNAMVGILLVGLTVLGALVPFLLAAGLLGVPALLVLRSRRRAATAPSPPSPAAAP